jgi:flagellar protein FlaG
MDIQSVGSLFAVRAAGPALVAANDASAAVPPNAVAAAPATKADAAQLAQAIDAVRKFVQPVAEDLHFSVDGATGKTIVQLVDGQSGAVLRQFPSEEMLSIARALDRMQGLLLHETI